MMKYLIAFGVFLVPITAVAADAPASLFFTADEARAIHALEDKSPPIAAGDVHLGAIFYYGEGDWALWLQNRLWTAATVSPDLRVLEVRPDEVRLEIAAPSGAAFRDATLKPHETYQLATGSIVEGDAEIAASR